MSNLANLIELDLWNNQIYDISPLANLSKPIEVNLINNPIKKIDLWNNLVSDLSPLLNLTKLTKLNLINNPIKKITPLSNLT